MKTTIKKIYERVLESLNESVNKITVEEDFSDDGIYALYTVAAKNLNLDLDIDQGSKISAILSGKDEDIIKFLIDIAEMSQESIIKKYPNLDFSSYAKEEFVPSSEPSNVSTEPSFTEEIPQ